MLGDRAIVVTGAGGGIGAAMQHMRDQQRGSIVNMTSAAQWGDANEAVSVKGAVASLTYSWAVAMESYGVRLNAVATTADTRMIDVMRLHRPSRVDWSPEQMAPLLTFLLSELAANITGQVIRLWDRELAVMTHPALAGPVIERLEPWTLDAHAEAFSSSMQSAVHQPLGRVVAS